MFVRTRNFLLAWLIASVAGWLMRGVFLNLVVDEVLRTSKDPVDRMEVFSALQAISTVFHGIVLFLVLEGMALMKAFRAIEEPLAEEKKS